ncbi:DUF3304 domain-containing protein [Klebsiella pneumoniae]|nr:DUF3304 domain-containing protein [Klebsiella pneumoniae]RCK88551.1 DUF3304 domain-containing protein [Klebsiella pneumoniae]
MGNRAGFIRGFPDAFVYSGWHHHPFITLNRQGESNEICINQPAAGGSAAVNRLCTASRGFADRAKYKAWIADIDAQKRQHSQTVPLPDYNGQDVCGITVHFLPCDDVKVTTSCWSPRNANYPIKEPVRMKEPAVCPK